MIEERTVAEFFAGIGMMRMGLERAGWRVVFANDIDEHKAVMYNGHFGAADPHLRLGDVHRLAADSVPTVTLATASFPCTDLSLAGLRAGLDGKQSSAFWGFARVLEGMGERRPPVVMLENVPGLLTSRGGDDLHAALATLAALGYELDAFVVDARQFVPQSRPRLFVVGSRIGGTDETTAVSEAEPSDVRPARLREFVRSHPELPWALRRLPPLPERVVALEDIVEDLGEGDARWWTEARIASLLDAMEPKHRSAAAAMTAAPRWSVGTLFRRTRRGRAVWELRTDGLAGCLRTAQGGSGKQVVMRAGHGRCRARYLTPREAARLMGAGEYEITVSDSRALTGFGDAVCVPVVEWIATNYLNPLAARLGGGAH